MSKDYIPQNEGELLPWLANLQLKLATHGAIFGMLPAEITAVSNDISSWANAINNVETIKANYKTAVEEKNAPTQQSWSGCRQVGNFILNSNRNTIIHCQLILG